MKVYISLLAGLVLTAHCGSTGIYDEATTNYVRIVRSGLNEWYPLNGNLSSKIGSADGTATAVYSGSVNRVGENNKAVCTNGAEIDFSSQNFKTASGTIAAWFKFNSLTAGPNSIFQNGSASTTYIGFRIMQSGTASLSISFGNGGGIAGGNFTKNGVATDLWYYLVFSYGNGTGTFYLGSYGSSINVVGSNAGPYGPDANPLRIFLNPVNACVDDLLNYNRALTAAEVQQNFQSLE